GDLGRFDGSGHLQLFGRKKNMIVTEGGKNIYPEDIENAFDGLPVKEYCIFAANYLWPQKMLGRETLILVLRLEAGHEFSESLKSEIIASNRRLPDFKRVGGYLLRANAFPRAAYARGCRKFIAVGGDGTSYEIVNGLFPKAHSAEYPTLAFLPLGTGNSFLREFSDQGVEFAIEAILARRSRPCDVLRLTHKNGVLHYINLLSMGFSADVATMRARRFSGWGELGYQFAIFLSLLDRKSTRLN